MRDGEVTAGSMLQCQALCRGKEGCSKFTFWLASHACHLSEASAISSTVGGAGAISGPVGCNQSVTTQADSCAAESPANGFPGLSARASDAAWPSGRQPDTLRCWPLDAVGNYQPCHLVKTLEDTSSGWPGKCRGLFQQEGVKGVKNCSESCRRSPSCPGWQVGLYELCFHGLGNECFVRPNFSPVAAQRLQHGGIRRLMDLRGWHIVGLTRQFGAVAGYFQDDQDAIDACRNMCYSDIGCHYWQYSPKFGCWIQDPWRAWGPPFPLTLDWAYRSTPYALDCIAGELIVHYCPSGMTEAVTEVRCASQGAKYARPAGAWSDRKLAASAADCQTVCAALPKCMYFSYYQKGLCRLFDASAAKAPAADPLVLSGPRSCVITTTTPVPVATTSTEQAAAADLQGPPAKDGETLEYMLQMNFVVKHMDFPALAKSYVLRLQRLYAEVIAESFEVHPNAIAAAPRSPGRRVGLLAKAPGSTQVVACVLNRPATSRDLGAYEEIAASTRLRADLEAATNGVVNIGDTAVVGPIEVAKLASVVLVQALPAPEPTGWERWWPFFLVVLLIGLAVAVIYGLVDTSERSRWMFGHDSAADASDSDGTAPLVSGAASCARDQTLQGSGGVAPGGARGPLWYARDQMRRGEFTV